MGHKILQRLLPLESMETISDAAEAAQRRQPHSLDCDGNGDSDRDGGGGDDDDGDCGERTYVRSFARLASAFGR